MNLHSRSAGNSKVPSLLAHNCFTPQAMPATAKKGPDMLLSMTSKPEITTDSRQAIVSGLVFGLAFSNHTILHSVKLNSTWDFALCWWTTIRGSLQLHTVTAWNILTLKGPSSSSHGHIQTHLYTHMHVLECFSTIWFHVSFHKTLRKKIQMFVSHLRLILRYLNSV